MKGNLNVQYKEIALLATSSRVHILLFHVTASNFLSGSTENEKLPYEPSLGLVG